MDQNVMLIKPWGCTVPLPLIVACIHEKTIENFDKCFKYI